MSLKGRQLIFTAIEYFYLQVASSRWLPHLNSVTDRMNMSSAERWKLRFCAVSRSEGLRVGGLAEEGKEKVEQMLSFEFTHSLLGDLCSRVDKVNMALECHEVYRKKSESATAVN